MISDLLDLALVLFSIQGIYQEDKASLMPCIDESDMEPMDADQARLARALTKLGVREIATLASLTPNTVSRIENGGDAKVSTVAALKNAYEGLGLVFLSTGDTATSPTICRVIKQ